MASQQQTSPVIETTPPLPQFSAPTIDYNNITSTFSSVLSNLQSSTDQSFTEVESAVQALLQSSVNLTSSYSYLDSVQELERVLSEVKTSQQRQVKSLTRSLSDVERNLARLTGDIAYADTPLSNIQIIPREFKTSNQMEGKIVQGRGYTDTEKRRLVTKKMRTRSIMGNWKVAPLYATAALLARWCNKCLNLPLIPVQVFTRLVRSGTGGPAVGGTAAAWRLGMGRDDAERTAAMMQEKWRKSATTGSFRRSAEIWGYALNFVRKEKRLTSKFAKGRISEEQYEERRKALGSEVTQILLKLGPTFIKVGQLLSTRIDIVPKAYIEELKLLQDNVPPFPGEVSKRIIEEELGGTLEELFDEFNMESLAAASLGQVHVAKKGDKTFAVKVQRQYLRELFEVDLKNLRQLAVFLDAVDPKAEGSLLDRNCERDWLSIYEESKRLLYEEIDYRKERENCERFAANFDLPKFSHIRVPKTYGEYSTEKVLCMEYVPGVKITDKAALVELGLDPVDIGLKSCEAYLEQLCRHGFFHCDPHPGNIAVERDDEGQARLIYYDFGMMDTFGEQTRKGFVDFLFAFYENEPRDACNALAQLGILREDPNIDRIAVERVGKDFMDRFQETLAQGDEAKFENQLTEEDKKVVNRQKRQKLGEEFLTMNTDVPFIFPPTWTFVFRAFMSLDGIGKTLDDKYDMTRIAKPYLKELIDLKDGSALKTVTLKIARRFGLRPVDLNMAVTQPRRTAFIEDVTRRLEQGDFKLRVRALETERALERSSMVQSNIFNAVCCGVLLNGALTLAATTATAAAARGGVAGTRMGAKGAKVLAKVMVVAATAFGVQVPYGIKKVRNLDKYFEKYGRKK
ncbi:hypothetical protein TrRE_jg2571 [Triparma retinervis]|uniref:ABC1 atypical kinase-like domain-containing protein n=1 Tax=Triparma retinervis TaxID=2557542 RepID=A0A9W7AGC6_9STRA|nr:hypothetical protein TrRE_jg2571 [Triparma retinervis]